MRAGEPDAMDRMVGFAFGALAVQLIQAGTVGRMVAVRDGNYTHVPPEAIKVYVTGPCSRETSVQRPSTFLSLRLS